MKFLSEKSPDVAACGFGSQPKSDYQIQTHAPRQPDAHAHFPSKQRNFQVFLGQKNSGKKNALKGYPHVYTERPE